MRLPLGEFQMGSTNRPDEQPVHPVRIPAFDMATTEVTVRQFRTFVQATGHVTDAERIGHSFLCCWRPKIGVNWRDPGFPQDDNEPVVAVSWNDAVAFAQWLSAETGEDYRLPSEAEWEYACRAGSTDEPSDAIGQFAWYADNSDGHTHTVGTKRPNVWGIYDLSGNAWEWCQDVYHANYNGAPTDGSPWMTGGDSVRRGYPPPGEGRVLRGGAWGLCDCKHPVSYDLSPSSRPAFGCADSCNNSGFRLVRTIAPTPTDTASLPSSPTSYTVHGQRIELIPIEPAAFKMGRDDGDRNERPAHQVFFRHAVLMGRTEVTVGQFRAFVEATGFVTDAERQGWAWDSNFRSHSTTEKKRGLSWRQPGFTQTDEEPVTCVSWKDAIEFCRWLSRETGRRFRLPSEAEWEYACRSMLDQTNKVSLDDCAWYGNNSGMHTHPVGSKKAHASGVCDLLGNVAEWVEDVWHPNYSNAPADGSSWLGERSDVRGSRGGSFERDAREISVTGRDWYGECEAIAGQGFRVVEANQTGSKRK